jgi:hypothetical protein
MIVAWHNMISDYVISATSEELLYPVFNIKDIRLTKIWKATDLSTQYIIIDCLAAINPGIIAILGHNLTDATVKILGHTGPDFTSPSFTYTFTEINDILWYEYIGANSYQYWAIKIESAVLIPKIGYVHIDTGDYLPELYPTTITPIGFDDSSVTKRSDSGSLFGYKNEVVLRTLSITVEDVPSAEYVYVITFRNYVGRSVPFIIIWDTSDTIIGIDNIYCHLAKNFEIPKLAGRTRFDFPLMVEEIK